MTSFCREDMVQQTIRRSLRREVIVTILCVLYSLVATSGLAEERSCSLRHSEVVLTLHTDGSVGVEYLLDRVVGSLKLPTPTGYSADVIVEDGEGTLNDQGVVVLPSPSNRVRMTLFADPPERRRAGAYPLAFSVEGRGVGVYLPYLLPEGCGETTIRLEGRAGVAAVVDGTHRRLEREYRVLDIGGFILLGEDLIPDSIIQTPKTLPVWLGKAIRESYLYAQKEIVETLGGHRMQVPILVDFSTVGGGEQGRNGGDAALGRNTVRLWFRGDAWVEEEADLRERMKDVLVHELVHCHQVPEIRDQWAHEGHARFVELFVATRDDGVPSSRNRAEQRLSQDFDGCMNDLRVGENVIDPYACGAVAYWLRWLETGQMNMLTREGAQILVERQTVAGRFLQRTASEADVVDFVRSTDIPIEVQKEAKESSESVRSRTIMTLLHQHCGAKSAFGFWTSEGSVTLDAPNCPLLDGFELQTIAGHHIIKDFHLSYAALVDSCGKSGRVLAAGIDGEGKWIRCDRSYQWPTTIKSKYRLIAPFEPAAVQAANQRRRD